MLQTCLLFHIANIKGTGGELIQRTKSSNPINSNRLVKVRGHYLKSTKHTVLYQEILTYCVSFRQCWDLSFLDAQTGSMNSMKMVMKVGNSPVITRKIQPFTLWREGLFIPLAFGRVFLNCPLPTHLQLTYNRFRGKITRLEVHNSDLLTYSGV